MEKQHYGRGSTDKGNPGDPCRTFCHQSRERSLVDECSLDRLSATWVPKSDGETEEGDEEEGAEERAAFVSPGPLVV